MKNKELLRDRWACYVVLSFATAVQHLFEQNKELLSDQLGKIISARQTVI